MCVLTLVLQSNPIKHDCHVKKNLPCNDSLHFNVSLHKFIQVHT